MGIGFDGYVGLHVLDTVRGTGASRMRVKIEVADGESWRLLNEICTDTDGQTLEPLVVDEAPGRYRFTFDFGEYFKRVGYGDAEPYLTAVPLELNLHDPDGYFLVVNAAPWGFSHYRGG